jgi:hypothetical protein
MEKILLSGLIAVPAEIADQIELKMAQALRELAAKIPNAEFKEVYNWNKRWGWIEDQDAREELSAIRLNNSKMCEVQVPPDLVGEI